MSVPSELTKFFDSNRGCQWDYPALPTDLRTPTKKRSWIEKQSGVPWLRLDMDFPHEEAEKEAATIRQRFVEHRGGEGHRGWRSVCIHGLNAEMTQDHTHYGYKDRDSAPYLWTDVADKCPVTVSWLKQVFPFVRYDRVRFMLLEPDGYICPHKDRDKLGLCATNVAITNPKGCEFVFENKGLVPWEPGAVFRLDVGQRHAVWNRSAYPRLHMIIHGEPGEDPRWQDLIARSYMNIERETDAYSS